MILTNQSGPNFHKPRVRLTKRKTIALTIMIFTLTAEQKKPALESFFINLEEKITLYKQHIEITSVFYNDEREKKLKLVSEEFDKVKDEVEKSYDEHYKAWDSAEEYRAIVAEEESGRQNMYDYFEIQEDDINEHYDEMFDYFNKSSLIILYALMESELKRLCGILKVLLPTRIDADDFKSENYIEGYFKYFDLVIGLEPEPLEAFKTKITTIQYVRNRVVHNGAEFNMEKNPTLDDYIKKSGGLLLLIHDTGLEKRVLKIFDRKYIDNAYELVLDLFHTLFWMINKRFDNMILKERVQQLFKSVYGETTVDIVKTGTVKGGISFSARIGYKDEQGTDGNFNCNITLTGAKSGAVNVINQDEKNKKLQSCADDFQRLGAKLNNRYLNGLLPENKAFKTEITLY